MARHQESNADPGPPPAVRSLRSKFEQMALDVSHSRSPSGHASFLLDPSSPRPRAASSSPAPPPDAHHLRATSSSSDLKLAVKRPPPPPPPRGSKAPSPYGSPLLLPVPGLPASPSMSTVSLPITVPAHSPSPSATSWMLVDAETPSTSPARSVASLRNKFASTLPASPPRTHTPRQSITTTYPSLFSEQNQPSTNAPAVPPRPIKNTEPSHPAHLPYPLVSSPVSMSPSASSSRIGLQSPFYDGASDSEPSISNPPPPLPTRTYRVASGSSDPERDSRYRNPGAHSNSSSLDSSESDVGPSSSPPPPSITTSRPTMPVPPRPPPRPRHSTVSSIDSSSSSSGPSLLSPPPLPVRRGTFSPPDEQQIPPRLPLRPVAIPAAPAIDPEQISSPSKSSSMHRLPPPPTRTIALGDKLPPARRPPSPSSDEDSGDEDDPKARTMDSMPDSSRSSRRPPALSAHQYSEFKVHVPSYTGHVVVAGEYIVAASHHHVKVFNLSVSDMHVFSLDGKDLGVKELKVTSMEFRPAAKETDRGFFLWLGTKDGHLFELDIRTGVVVGTKLSAHSHTVTHIFRHGRSMISLDDTGKTLIFTPDPSSREDVRLGHTQPRVYRIAEKQDFAKVFRGRLWTAARSEVNGGGNLKTPIIRVYDVYTPGSSGRSLLPTEPVGAITSGAILSAHPDHVYLGHEGGFVSVWSLGSEDGFPHCMEVMKVSVSDVLSLDGVNDRLWAGGRKGMIAAYDVHPRPWIMTNCWVAHGDLPVLKLAVDYYGIEKLGKLRVVSVGRDEQIRFWDGLLASDWIDQELLKRETSFSKFRKMSVLLVSWNADAARPDGLTGEAANVNFLHDVLSSVDSPDIVSFGLQEVIDLESRKMTAKNVLIGKKKGEDGGLSEKVTGAYKRWYDRLVLAMRLAMPPDVPYSVVHSESLVGMFSCIFIKNTERMALQDIAVTTIKRGMGGRYGNKGGILVRFVVDDSSLCFINCHLAAGQNHVRQRNGDVAAFVEDRDLFPVTNALVEPVAYVGGGDGSMVLDHEIVFVNGDMNYRIDQRRDAIIAAVHAGDHESLLAHDQLLKEMKHNRGFRFRTFTEGPLTFAPTYKYDRRSSEYDSSEKRRLPAWCDRVLWRSRVPSRVQQLHYRRYEVNASDHRPISAGFTMTTKSVRPEVRAGVKMEVELMWVGEQARLLAAARAFYAREALI